MPRRVRSAATISVLCALAAGCAPLQSRVELTGVPGAPGRGPVPIYFGLAPDFPTRAVGSIDADGQGARAHLEDLLDEAEARARALGADALLVRDVRTAARYVPRTEMRPCSRGGLGGLQLQFMCPTTVMVLEFDMHLHATAVRRGEEPPRLTPPWGAPTGLGSAAPWATVGTVRPPTLPDLDDALTPPP